MPVTRDPHTELCALLTAAAIQAAHRADMDPDFPSAWGDAEAALQLAITGLPQPDDGALAVADGTCLTLVRRALELLDNIDASRRRPDHILDRAYILAALQQIERAVAVGPGPA